MSVLAAPSAGTTLPPAGVLDGQTSASRIVLRNMTALVLSQFATTPVSLVVNAMLARSLGADSFGAIYLATTIVTLGMLLVDWGGTALVAAEIARNRSAAARVFGTGLALRVLLAGALLAGLPQFAAVMGYDATIRTALILCGVRFAIVSLGTLCSAVLRGFEKLNLYARATVFGNLIDAALVIAVLLNGGRLRAALTAQVVAALITLGIQISFVLGLKIGRLRIDSTALRVLFRGGLAFFVLEVVLKLQPYIDAAFLSKLAPSSALGWYGAASRITGVLVFPALTLNFALYPTLARLWQDDRATYLSMVRLGIRAILILGVLAGTGTAIFAGLIVTIVYGTDAYGPTATDLSILSVYVPLVYVSIVVTASLASAGKQLRWAGVQSFCLLVSVALDPILIPWAQQRYGNGSAGVCLSVAFAEVAMVAGGFRLLPEGVLTRSLVRTLRCCLIAAAGMAVVGFGLRQLPVVAIAATVATYGGLLWVQGEIDQDLVSLLRNLVRNKMGAATARARP